MAHKPRFYPALTFRSASDLDDEQIGALVAELGDDDVTAVDTIDGLTRVFFTSSDARDRAKRTLTAAHADALIGAADISDENWAERSQSAVTAVDLGGITVAPPWDVPAGRDGVVIIQPSMGFGTAHHESTRLCLRLLQTIDVRGTSVFDAGTGSGVLAIAAAQRGAQPVLAADYDADAIASARENVELNGLTDAVSLLVLDLSLPRALDGRRFDLVFANLTGGLLSRFAATLANAAAPGGRVITSGYTLDEEALVTSALTTAGLSVEARLEENTWLGKAFRAA